MSDKKVRFPTAICKECSNPIYLGDGKVDKKGMWTCTDCMIKKDTQ
jgi:hypothetical protein